MKYSGRARRAAFKLIGLSLIVALAAWGGVGLLTAIGNFLMASRAAILAAVIVAWALFAAFTLYFFRDPDPRVPSGTGLVVSPAHAKVDVIDAATEAEFMGGPCQRISMFLSVIDVHVQHAPVSGTVALVKHSPGRFVNALRTDSAACNENVLVGFAASEPAREKLAVRLVAGAIARRIVPFVKTGDVVARGDRISLIQFGSRADVYLPLHAKIKVQLGEHVMGGETVLAAFD